MTYTQVWYIICIVSSCSANLHSEKIGLIRVTYDPLSVLGLINILSDLYSSVIHHWNCHLKPILFPHRKNWVNWGHYSPPLSAIGLRDVYLAVDLVSQWNRVSQSKLNSLWNFDIWLWFYCCNPTIKKTLWPDLWWIKQLKW